MKKIIKHIKEIYEYRDMIGGLVKRDLRGRYKGSVLGFFWNLLNPMFQIIVYIIIFSYVFRSGLDYYPIYLVVGMMPWNFFAESIKEGAGTIVHQSDLVKKIYFPREVMVVSTVTSRLINFFITYAIVLLVILLLGYGICIWTLPLVLLSILILFILSLGVALLLSAVDVYFRDIEHITGVLLMALVWATPIMYAKSYITGKISMAVSLNPMTWYIKLFQDILYFKTVPKLYIWLICLAGALLTLFVGEIIFIRLNKNFAEEL